MAITFQSPLEELINYEELKTELMAGRGPLVAAGCMESQKIHLLCELTEGIPLRLIITYNETRAREILEELESGAAVAPAPAAPVSDQISLLDIGAQTVLSKLRMTDVNVLSPIEALNLLAELKQDLKG